jgi:hypothetical protein
MHWAVSQHIVQEAACGASGQITMRKVDGWEILSQPIEPFALHQAA